MGGNFDALQEALDAGADVNGHPEQPFPLIVGAAMADNIDMIRVLLTEGADPDRPVTEKVICPEVSPDRTTPGERALHIAAKRGNVQIVRWLLTRAHANPNVTDETGCTPLFSACERQPVCEEVVRLLLEAGASPALAEENGYTPLHLMARCGKMDLVVMLYSRAPSTLNSLTANGFTPLFVACAIGHEGIVSKLLSLGARQPTPLSKADMCPLAIAIDHGFVGVVRVLANEGGIRAVGGLQTVVKALAMAVQVRQARILGLLLAADGDKKRSMLANVFIDDEYLLHIAAACGYPAAVSVLLRAGADEAVRDLAGRIPRDVVGVDIGLEGEPRMDQGKDLAVRRMLQRGPAYRARSWAWPSDKGADVGGSDDSGTAGAAAVLSSPPALKTPLVIGLRIFRPKNKRSRKFFVGLIGRYCAKD